jgi:hypothetical protein
MNGIEYGVELGLIRFPPRFEQRIEVHRQEYSNRALLMQRLRAERAGRPLDGFPKRIRKRGGGRKRKHAMGPIKIS